jgi:hypothetical protein
MLRRWCVYVLVLSSWCAAAGDKPHSAQPAQKAIATKLPITTSSPEARNSFEKAMHDYEQYRYP